MNTNLDYIAEKVSSVFQNALTTYYSSLGLNSEAANNLTNWMLIEFGIPEAYHNELGHEFSGRELEDIAKYLAAYQDRMESLSKEVGATVSKLLESKQDVINTKLEELLGGE
jgi:nitrogenase molybdenum-iron protein alpha/beta subunit